jgi:hypothetical protein
MTRTTTLEWLALFQAEFTAVLRVPLDRSSRILRADVPRYDAAACARVRPGQRSAAERLAVYNRQYWFRLFGVFQNEYPLTARLIGMWHFNALVAEFLRTTPPRQHDLAAAADGFEAYLVALQSTPAWASLAPSANPLACAQAASIDAAFRAAARAESAPPFRPNALQRALESLAEVQLKPSPAFALLEESWPLLKLRRASLDAEGERALDLPEPYPDGPHSWALSRTQEGLHVLALARLQALLLRLLCTHRVGAALERLEAECSPTERSQLPANVQRWLAQGVRHGFWRGIAS